MKLTCCFKPTVKPTLKPFVEMFRPTSNTIEPGWIYLIMEREFINSKENVFKIGKTKNIRSRMPSYPRNSLLYHCFYCETNIHEVEKYFIRCFDNTFTQRSDIGREYYFSENKTDIIKYFHDLILNVR